MAKVPGAMFPYEDFRNGLTTETLDAFKQFIISTITARHLHADQKEALLASAASKTMPYPPMSEEARQALMDDILCILAEGGMPFHFRYLAPDYKKLLTTGSEFLEFGPASDLYDATAMLLTAYKYVPDHGLTPVCLGRLDQLLDPFIDTLPREEAQATLRHFWLLVDRLFPDAFVHASIGPRDSLTGRYLLNVDRELKTITNLSLLYDLEQTETTLLLHSVENALSMHKPYFFNHDMMLKDWGEDYAVASCYNCMLTGGGIYTMVRLNLKRLVELRDATVDNIVGDLIPEMVALQMEVINSRIQYLVEELGFFQSSFMLEEGLLHRDRFTAYAAVFGLAEAVNLLMEKSGKPGCTYGHDPEANDLGRRMIECAYREVKNIPALCCGAIDGKVSFHAQVGINPDVDVTPGVRVPPGTEPELYQHIEVEANHHALLDGGVSTILTFDPTARENPEAVIDILRGAMRKGIRTLSVGCSDSEFIRVSGYLVRRSDLEKAKLEKELRYDTIQFAHVVFQQRPEALSRRIRKV